MVARLANGGCAPLEKARRKLWRNPCTRCWTSPVRIRQTLMTKGITKASLQSGFGEVPKKTNEFWPAFLFATKNDRAREDLFLRVPPNAPLSGRLQCE